MSSDLWIMWLQQLDTKADTFWSHRMFFLDAVAAFRSFQMGSMDWQWGQLLATYSTTFTGEDGSTNPSCSWRVSSKGAMRWARALCWAANLTSFDLKSQKKSQVLLRLPKVFYEYLRLGPNQILRRAITRKVCKFVARLTLRSIRSKAIDMKSSVLPYQGSRGTKESNRGKAMDAFLHALVMIFAFTPVVTVAFFLLPLHRLLWLRRFGFQTVTERYLYNDTKNASNAMAAIATRLMISSRRPFVTGFLPDGLQVLAMRATLSEELHHSTSSPSFVGFASTSNSFTGFHLLWHITRWQLFGRTWHHNKRYGSQWFLSMGSTYLRCVEIGETSRVQPPNPHLEAESDHLTSA